MCEFQARLHSEEVNRHLLLQQLQQQDVEGKTGVESQQPSARYNGEILRGLSHKLLLFGPTQRAGLSPNLDRSELFVV